MKNVCNRKNVIRLLTLCFSFVLIVSFASTQIASGGNHTLTQMAIANGGASGNGASVGGTYSIEGTIGQSVAGQQAANSPYSVHAGFWNAQPLALSAADVSVSGIVQTAAGQGSRNVRMTMSSGDGATKPALTRSFGYFRFDDVTTGQTYVLIVSSKRFRFAQPSQFLKILDEVSDIIFIALPS